MIHQLPTEIQEEGLTVYEQIVQEVEEKMAPKIFALEKQLKSQELQIKQERLEQEKKLKETIINLFKLETFSIKEIARIANTSVKHVKKIKKDLENKSSK